MRRALSSPDADTDPHRLCGRANVRRGRFHPRRAGRERRGRQAGCQDRQDRYQGIFHQLTSNYGGIAQGVYLISARRVEVKRGLTLAALWAAPLVSLSQAASWEPPSESLRVPSIAVVSAAVQPAAGQAFR
jgi:hypothetical protein